MNTHDGRSRRAWWARAALAGGVCALAVGCVGSIHDPVGATGMLPDGGTVDGNGTAIPVTGDAGAGGDVVLVPLPDVPLPDGSVAADAGVEDTGTDAGCGVQIPAPALRRLTNAEYARTVRDLVGETTAITAAFPPDPVTAGFDNNQATQHIVTLAVERYQDAAEAMAASVLADPVRRAQVVGCDITTGDVCLTGFIARFGRLAYRRPLTPEESAGLLALAHAASADDPSPQTAAVGIVMRAVLQSPYFLFRPEVGVADPAHPGWMRLTGYEMATRLAYTLWGTTPDTVLLDAAGAGSLDTADGVAAQARRMLADPRARDAGRSFTDQWLQLNTFPGINISRAVFMAWNENLRTAMTEETHRYLDDFLWTRGNRVVDLLTARYTYLNPLLAAHYGLTVPGGGDGGVTTPDGGVSDVWARVDLPADSPRGGLLTQGSVLTLTSNPDEASPVHRGKYVREQLLCEDIGAPPPDVPPLPPRQPGLTQRQRLDMHRTAPACAGCHNRMDPVGFGLERFDGIGRYALTDDQGRPLSGAGSIQGFTPADFVGQTELEQRLHDSDEFPTCVVTQMFRFSNGRLEGPADSCTIQQVHDAFQAGGYSFPTLLVSLVTHDAFRYILPASAGGAP